MGSEWVMKLVTMRIPKMVTGVPLIAELKRPTDMYAILKEILL